MHRLFIIVMVNRHYLAVMIDDNIDLVLSRTGRVILLLLVRASTYDTNE
jgi:hypothetical protein